MFALETLLIAEKMKLVSHESTKRQICIRPKNTDSENKQNHFFIIDTNLMKLFIV